MIHFLLKGLIRDRSRSFFPILVVLSGVALTVIMYSWIQGVLNNMISSNAAFDTGHVKIMSRAYAEQAELLPNDLALVGIDSLMEMISSRYPKLYLSPRIRFGGLLDFPDDSGETRIQAPVPGLGVNLLSPDSREIKILNLRAALARGRLPAARGEILVSDQFARRIGARLGDVATLIASTMNGSLAFYNFTIVGTVQFGIAPLDRGGMIADLTDVQFALEMEDAASEILGFFPDLVYKDEQAVQIAADFNQKFSRAEDEFSPIMFALRDQSGLAQILDLVHAASGLIIAVFVLAMSIVLWNAGLMGSLRRYGEIGLRLAIGENKGEVYRSLIYESLFIGVFGSIIGTTVGLLVAYYLQFKGVNIGSMIKESTMMVSSVFRARVTFTSYYIGFFPGLLATLLGTMISGIGIYKRPTSQLFQELEA